MAYPKIPDATVRRLSAYSRYLSGLENPENTFVSSTQMADAVCGTPAQVRKDLAYFGKFGMRGIGYNAAELNDKLMDILGVYGGKSMVLVGVGNLGKAMARYQGFQDRRFFLKAVFDRDVDKVGLSVNGITIRPISELESFVRKNGIDIGMICTPAEFGQEIADILLEAGIKGIMNFTPRPLNIPWRMPQINVDLTESLELLSYHIEQD